MFCITHDSVSWDGWIGKVAVKGKGASYTSAYCQSDEPHPGRGHLYIGSCCKCKIGEVLIIKMARRDNMGEVVHTSKIKIVREKGPTRRAMIEGFSEPVYYGVHGGIMKFYKVEPDKEHAATLDHIVAATAG
jgi:hypothetical protein